MYARQKSRDISTGGNHCRGKDSELEKKRKRLSNAQKASVHEDTVFGKGTEDMVGERTEDVVGKRTEDIRVLHSLQ